MDDNKTFKGIDFAANAVKIQAALDDIQEKKMRVKLAEATKANDANGAAIRAAKAKEEDK